MECKNCAVLQEEVTALDEMLKMQANKNRILESTVLHLSQKLYAMMEKEEC